MRTHVYKYLEGILENLSYEGDVLDTAAGWKTDYYDKLYRGRTVKKQDFFNYKEGTIDYICDICDMSNIPDDAFGLVLCLESLEHIEYPRKAIEEMTKKLTMGGFLIATVPLGFHIHHHPKDFWRYCPDGMWSLFRGKYNVHDFTIEGHPKFPRAIWTTVQKVPTEDINNEENTYKVCHPNIVEVHDDIDLNKRSHKLLKHFAKWFGYELIRIKY
ncbi:class I SAM-dependent methyltransferase [Planctomycetota bacterium]